MAYCEKCGTELQETSAYCPTCGTKVEQVGVMGILDGVQKGTAPTMFGGSQVLQQRTKLFWIGAAAVLLNFVLHFCKTLSMDLWITEKSYSVLEFTKKAKEYSYGSDAAFYGAVHGLLIICVILILLSLAAMTAPVFIRKPMAKKQVLPALLTVLFSFIVQSIMLILILKASNAYTGGTLTFGGWMYLLETLATLVILFKLRKTKSPSQTEIIKAEKG